MSSEQTPCTGMPADQRERPRGHQAHPQPGERARPDPDRDAGQVDAAVAPACASTCSIPGASISPCRIDSSDSKVATTEVAVVERDGHVRGGGVEGEQHGPSPQNEQLVVQRGPTGVSVEGADVVVARGSG